MFDGTSDERTLKRLGNAEDKFDVELENVLQIKRKKLILKEKYQIFLP